MKDKIEQFFAQNLNPVLNVTKDGVVLYSNVTGEPLLNSWGIEAGEKLPLNIIDLVQKVIFRNSPEKLEIRVGNKVYLVVFSPLAEQECVIISGFEISNQKEHEETFESEEKYRTIFESSLDAVLLTTPDRTIQAVNPAACKLFRMTEDELIQAGRYGILDIPDLRLKPVLEERARPDKLKGELNYRRKDGSVFSGEVSHVVFKDKNGIPISAIIIRDATERKQLELEREMSIVFLQLMNESKETTDLIQSVVSFFRKSYDLEAVGIRLKSGDDYPYFESSGFPEEFSKSENSLCTRDNSGKPVYDSAGNPVLECMCGNVICGRVDPSKPFFTSRGSFWTNSTTELLASTTEADRQNRTRNRCNGEGYESVALIALRVGNERLGLLQLNDRRKGKISLEMIGTLERLADYLAATLTKKLTEEALRETFETLQAQSEELTLLNEKLETKSKELIKVNKALRKSEAKYRHIVEASQEGIWSIDRNNKTIYVNNRVPEMLGYSIDEILGQPPQKFLAPEFQAVADDRLREHRQRVNQLIDYRFVRKDGSDLWCILSSHQMFDDKGKYAGSTGMLTDITERKQAEEALQKSESELARAQQISQIGSWTWDLVTNELTWSEQSYRNYGLEPGEVKLSYELFLSFIVAEDRENVNREVRKAIESGHRYNVTYNIIRKDGTPRILLSENEIVRDESGKTVLMYGTNQDITERKRVEEELKKALETLRYSEDQFRGLFQSVKSGVALIDETGRFAVVNPTFMQIFGLDNELDILNVNSQDWSQWEVYGEDGKLLHIDDHPVRKVMLTGKPVKSQLVAVRNPGANELSWMLISAEPVMKEDGRIYRIICTYHDITELKKAEEVLRESESRRKVTEAVEVERQRLYDVLEALPVMICLLTPDYHVAFANRTFREKFGDSGGRRCYEYCFNRTEPCEFCEAYKVLETGQLHHWEFSSPDGSIFDAYDLPFTDVDGSPMILEMDINITERKKAEKALENIETARKKEIHHRIKNNLQVISSLLDLQAEQFRDRNDIKDSEVLEAFKESQNRVISMALIHEELYKGEGFETLDFSPYIQELAESLFNTYRLGKTSVILSMDLEENLFFDMDTAVPLGIIVNELISNSLKHAFPSREKGEIQIKLSREKKEECIKIKNVTQACKSTNFTLRVSDNGIGIPENLDIKNLDSLGFQLVTSLVDQLDGNFELKTNNGTQFTMRFGVTEKDTLIQVGLKSQENR
ncbi:MAG: PAS domain S-box protein [Methanosarcina sp.]